MGICPPIDWFVMYVRVAHIWVILDERLCVSAIVLCLVWEHLEGVHIGDNMNRITFFFLSALIGGCQPQLENTVTDPVVLDDVENIAVGMTHVAGDIECYDAGDEGWGCGFYGSSAITVRHWEADRESSSTMYSASVDLDGAHFENVEMDGSGTLVVGELNHPYGGEDAWSVLDASVLVDNERFYDLDLEVTVQPTGRIIVDGEVDGQEVSFELAPTNRNSGNSSFDDCRTQVGIDCGD